MYKYCARQERWISLSQLIFDPSQYNNQELGIFDTHTFMLRMHKNQLQGYTMLPFNNECVIFLGDYFLCIKSCFKLIKYCKHGNFASQTLSFTGIRIFN